MCAVIGRGFEKIHKKASFKIDFNPERGYTLSVKRIYIALLRDYILDKRIIAGRFAERKPSCFLSLDGVLLGHAKNFCNGRRLIF